jgi:hypothetical protein
MSPTIRRYPARPNQSNDAPWKTIELPATTLPFAKTNRVAARKESPATKAAAELQANITSG